MSEPPVQVAEWTSIDPAVAYRILRLRVDVFVVEQECPYPELDGRDLEPGTRHFWVEADDGILGYLRMLDDGGEARIGRVCVHPAHRGGGLANRLMNAALDEVGDRPSVLDAQTYVSGWYERFGYRVAGPEFLEDGIAHVPMRRDAPARKS